MGNEWSGLAGREGERGRGGERGGGAPAFTGVATYRPQLGTAFIHVSVFQLASVVTVVVV